MLSFNFYTINLFYGGFTMARNRNIRKSLIMQSQDKLKSKLAIGHSKQEDKKQERLLLRKKKEADSKASLTYDERVTIHKIYSWGTFRTYLKHCCYFVNWCLINYNCHNLDDCRQYVDEWIISRSDLSAYTQKLEASALAKLFDCTTEDFIPTKTRYRKDIVRSRTDAARDKNFNLEKHADFIRFCKATGLRKREIKLLRGNSLIYKNGLYYISVTRGGKGGRCRESLIVSDVEYITELMKKAGLQKVWSRVPDLDVHSYRADYCRSVYSMFARPTNNIPFNERFHCRKDLKGICYDKRAMLITSRFLGHNRINIIAEHYLV